MKQSKLLHNKKLEFEDLLFSIKLDHPSSFSYKEKEKIKQDLYSINSDYKNNKKY